MNKLLKEQIGKYFKDSKKLPKELRQLFSEISNSYDDFEQELTMINESIEDCVVITDPKGLITHANSSMCKKHNIKKRISMIGKNLINFVPKKDHKQYREDFSKAKKGEVVNTEYSTPSSKNNTKYTLRSYSPIKNDKGAVTAIHIQCKDITPQKQAEERAKTSEARLFSFIDSNDSLVFLKDKEFKYIIINKANADFFGKKVKEIIGKDDYQFMPKRSAANCRKTDKEALSKKKIIISTEIVGDRHYETRKFPVYFNGEIIGVGGIIRDVTDRKEAEVELQKKVEQMEFMGRTNIKHHKKLLELKEENRKLRKKLGIED